MPAKEAKSKNVIDSIMYSYSTTSNQVEEENKILKETVSRLKQEIEFFKSNPLMVCEVREIFERNVLIKIPNGNQFLVNVSSECGKLKAGDLVLVEQKNLTIIRKVPIARKFNVEKFVIIEKPTTSWDDV